MIFKNINRHVLAAIFGHIFYVTTNVAMFGRYMIIIFSIHCSFSKAGCLDTI